MFNRLFITFNSSSLLDSFGFGISNENETGDEFGRNSGKLFNFNLVLSYHFYIYVVSWVVIISCLCLASSSPVHVKNEIKEEPEKIKRWREEQVKRLEEKGNNFLIETKKYIYFFSKRVKFSVHLLNTVNFNVKKKLSRNPRR